MKDRIVVDEQSFNIWLENPCTEYYFEYLLSFRDQIVKDDSGSFVQGHIGDEVSRTSESAKCYLLLEMANPSFDEIEDFYNEGVDDDTDVGELPDTT